ncbi:hypothetical protein GCM10009077_42810 [Roseibium denhamense]
MRLQNLVACCVYRKLKIRVAVETLIQIDCEVSSGHGSDRAFYQSAETVLLADAQAALPPVLATVSRLQIVASRPDIVRIGRDNLQIGGVVRPHVGRPPCPVRTYIQARSC